MRIKSIEVTPYIPGRCEQKGCFRRGEFCTMGTTRKHEHLCLEHYVNRNPPKIVVGGTADAQSPATLAAQDTPLIGAAYQVPLEVG